MKHEDLIKIINFLREVLISEYLEDMFPGPQDISYISFLKRFEQYL